MWFLVFCASTFFAWWAAVASTNASKRPMLHYGKPSALAQFGCGTLAGLVAWYAFSWTWWIFWLVGLASVAYMTSWTERNEEQRAKVSLGVVVAYTPILYVAGIVTASFVSTLLAPGVRTWVTLPLVVYTLFCSGVGYLVASWAADASGHSTPTRSFLTQRPTSPMHSVLSRRGSIYLASIPLAGHIALLKNVAAACVACANASLPVYAGLTALYAAAPATSISPPRGMATPGGHTLILDEDGSVNEHAQPGGHAELGGAGGPTGVPSGVPPGVVNLQLLTQAAEQTSARGRDGPYPPQGSAEPVDEGSDGEEDKASDDASPTHSADPATYINGASSAGPRVRKVGVMPN